MNALLGRGWEARAGGSIIEDVWMCGGEGERLVRVGVLLRMFGSVGVGVSGGAVNWAIITETGSHD